MPDLRANGITLRHESGGAGPPLVLLNGILMTMASWAPLQPELQRVRRVVSHDLRGQLLSSWPDRDWDLSEHVVDLLALLDHLGIERCDVVGTSYGGEVGLLFAAAHPGRVRSLSVIASVAHVEPPLRRRVEAWAEAAGQGPAALYRALVPDTFSPAFLGRNPGLVDQGEARLAACPPGFFTAFGRLARAFLGLEARPLLGRIQCPTLVVAAELDTLKPPAYSRVIADGVPGARLVTVPAAGHAVVVEQPEQVARLLLEFLAT